MSELKPLSPSADRAYQIYYAKVMLNEARSRRHFHAMHANLLSWAASGRRRAAEATALIERDLFGAAIANTVAEMEGR